MSFDLISKTKELELALKECGYYQFSDQVHDARTAGSTGGEILDDIEYLLITNLTNHDYE